MEQGTEKQLRIELDFLPNQEQLICSDQRSDILTINLSSLMKKSENLEFKTVVDFFQEIIAKYSDGVTIFSIQQYMLEDSLYDMVSSNWSFSIGNIEFIRDCFALWRKMCHQHKVITDDSFLQPKKIVRLQKFRENELYVRPGILEVRALQTWFYDKPKIQESLDSICANINSEDYMYANEDRELRKHWFDFRDSNHNIRLLMTNAGFYFDPTEVTDHIDTFNDWAERYFRALTTGNILTIKRLTLEMIPIYQEIRDLRRDPGMIEPFLMPQRKNFYECLEGKRVLFVTPFAAEIQENFDSGRMFNIWNDCVIPKFSLSTLLMPISTYPERPHRSWSDTFHQMCQRIDSIMENQSINFFTATAGCYGLPLCEYVYSKYGITTVYFGNQVNTFFGLRQNRTESYEVQRRNVENWTFPRSAPKTLSRIESGAYLFTPSPSK